jgi:hypothetical protein
MNAPDLFPPPPLDQWPADLRDQYYERVAIMAASGVVDPESKALADTWGKR